MLKTPFAGTFNLARAVVLLLLANLACRPVITIGWGELLLVAVLGAVILGPVLIRIYRRLGGDRDQDRSDRNE
jgi:hypothetical protein